MLNITNWPEVRIEQLWNLIHMASMHESSNQISVDVIKLDQSQLIEKCISVISKSLTTNSAYNFSSVNDEALSRKIQM